MRGKVSFTNARKRKVYKVKSFDLKNTKFKVQKSTASSSFWIPGTNFQMQIFSFKKTTSPTNNKKKPIAPQQQNKPETKQIVFTNVLLMPSLITLLWWTSSSLVFLLQLTSNLSLLILTLKLCYIIINFQCLMTLIFMY